MRLVLHDPVVAEPAAPAPSPVRAPEEVSPAVAGRVLVGYAWRRRRLVWSLILLLLAGVAGLFSFLLPDPQTGLWLADLAIVCFVIALASLVLGRIVVFLALVSLAMLPLAAILHTEGRIGPGGSADEFNRDWFFVTAALVVAALARSLEQIAVIGWRRSTGRRAAAPILDPAAPAEPVEVGDAGPRRGTPPRRGRSATGAGETQESAPEDSAAEREPPKP